MTQPPQEMSPEFIAYSNGPTLLAQVVPIYAIAVLVVLGRCYVRAVMVKSFRWDDWTMVVCLVGVPVTSAVDKSYS
jgi:ethanolamine transporter EutH